ncbi:MAG: gas vesicle protein GvpD P-loop domain-containing protein [Promethearchaeota archaeon]
MPQEILEFLNRQHGQTLLIKGRSGTGKTTFALSLFAELVAAFPKRFKPKHFLYLSSRVDTPSLESQFPWAKEILSSENIVDAVPSTVDDSDVSIFSDELTFISAVNDRLLSQEPCVCVIDSFDAIVEATRSDPQRLAVALSHLNARTKAKIILVQEGDHDSPLDHITDSTIILTKSMTEGQLWRSIRIDKLRGTRIQKGVQGFTLSSNRFQVLPSYDVEQARRPSTFQVIPHSAGKFSSGIQTLDEIIGSFRRGSTLFLDVGRGVQNEVTNTLILNFIANFLLQCGGVVMVPPNMLSFRRLKSAALHYGFVDQLNTRLRLFVSATSELSMSSSRAELGEPYYKAIASRESKDLENAWIRVPEELRSQGCSNILNIVGFGWLQSWLGPGDLPQWATRIANDTARESDLSIVVGYSSTAEINPYLADLSEVHISLSVKTGATILRGINPPTTQYCIFHEETGGKTSIGFREIA